jgi:hypothetical protein
MKKLIIITTALIAVVIASSVVNAFSDWKKPWFCHNNDCPIYELLDKKEEYEIRYLRESKWASIEIETDNYLWAQMVGYYKLFRYFKGRNDQDKHLPMTAPVHTFSYSSKKTTYRISFYLPYEYQMGQAIPVPTDSSIQICTVPGMKQAVREFGGYIYEEKQVVDHLNLLRSKLDDEGTTYLDEYEMSATYDNPFRMRGRHNEVSVILKDAFLGDQNMKDEVICK